MSVTNLGDLSHAYSMRQRNVSLRQDIERLSTELATGQVADLQDVLAGNYSQLTDIERRTSTLEAYRVATAEATLYSGAMQGALGRFEESAIGLASSLRIAGNGANGLAGADTATEARTALETMIGSLNASSAGRYLLSGAASDAIPLSNAEDFLTAVRTAASGATTPDDLLTATELWFDDPAGFEAVLYQGSADAISPMPLSQTDRISLDVRASDPKLREALRMVAVAALADDPAFGFDVQSKAELFEKTAQGLQAQQNNLIGLQIDVGFVEGRIEEITTRNSAERTSLSFAKAALLEVDPFEAATKLEQAQFQLESLYTLTVRSAQLSLVNYL